ncbi:hypothetical protein DFA_10594 [Cavenderia fasciculata]|uniref:Anaphase-promoting complex subunit 4 WD40 domain-containing protein n=1 Tax=Cavenderia fasciculata TaxID=261658 RepID=F4QAN2_CACFS|nr:uncharacterized protein DFA_10594 [Cavenderia fasciculata]EGG15751.1 hypothetical protein DFA_10594 [Cavenderia fasciculata]|eukprot:XP_004354498.1 hypothetical protein DFA_10594 [Cavenderia fasciculata]
MDQRPKRDKQDDLQFNIRLFNLDNTQQVAEIKGHNDPSYSISFSPDNKSLFNLDNTHASSSISFSPDNKSIAIGGSDGYVIINEIKKS